MPPLLGPILSMSFILKSIGFLASRMNLLFMFMDPVKEP